MNLSSNVIDKSNDEYNFVHKLLLTNTQVFRLCKTFVNNSSANIKLSKTLKTGQSGGFLGRSLGPYLKISLPLMKHVLKPLTKTVLNILFRAYNLTMNKQNQTL